MFVTSCSIFSTVPIQSRDRTQWWQDQWDQGIVDPGNTCWVPISLKPCSLRAPPNWHWSFLHNLPRKVKEVDVTCADPAKCTSAEVDGLLTKFTEATASCKYYFIKPELQRCSKPSRTLTIWAILTPATTRPCRYRTQRNLDGNCRWGTQLHWPETRTQQARRGFRVPS